MSETESLIDAGGSIVMPTYVDCHTHACWTGDRLDEFERIIGGESYLDILAEGGGIMSTVQAVRPYSVQGFGSQGSSKQPPVSAIWPSGQPQSATEPLGVHTVKGATQGSGTQGSKVQPPSPSSWVPMSHSHTGCPSSSTRQTVRSSSVQGLG